MSSEFSSVNINLSRVEDVVLLDHKTGKPQPPTKTPTIDMLDEGVVFDLERPICCMVRRPYLPIANKDSKQGCIIPPDGSFMNYCTPKTFEGKPIYFDTPQIVRTTDDKVGYLWYLNKNNLALTEPTDGTLGVST